MPYICVAQSETSIDKLLCGFLGDVHIFLFFFCTVAQSRAKSKGIPALR